MSRFIPRSKNIKEAQMQNFRRKNMKPTSKQYRHIKTDVIYSESDYKFLLENGLKVGEFEVVKNERI